MLCNNRRAFAHMPIHTQTDIRFHGYKFADSRKSTRRYGPRKKHKMVGKPTRMCPRRSSSASDQSHEQTVS